MNHLTRQIVAAAFGTIIASAALAATPPPRPPFNATSWDAASRTKPTTGLRMGSFKVQFEKTTLAMVRKAAGSGEITHQGDASESINWLCYTIQDQTRYERIWIISGEMGGSEHAVTQVSAQVIQKTEVSPDCPVLPATLQPLAFDKGVWLGMQTGQALNALGRPSHQEDPWWIFRYQGKIKEPENCEPEGFDVINWFMFETQNGRLFRIHVGQVSSC